MQRIEYGVVILNYCTAKDSIQAAQSVIDNAKEKNYQICIVDGGSPDASQFSQLVEANLERTSVIRLQRNKGYAYGNNAGFAYLKEKYHMNYAVIMNPDVRLLQFGTIEKLISRAEEHGSSVVGAQALVWTRWKNTPKERQINIRRTYTYLDCLIEASPILKRLFRSRYQKQIYADDMPYNAEIFFKVPSGAFFIIEASVFDQIGRFDDDTFLYTEELIIGKKLELRNLNMVLVPSVFVTHESGKSIGSNAKRVSAFAFREEMKSLDVYLLKYLHANKVQLKLLHIIKYLTFMLKLIKYRLQK